MGRACGARRAVRDDYLVVQNTLTRSILLVLPAALAGDAVVIVGDVFTDAHRKLVVVGEVAAGRWVDQEIKRHVLELGVLVVQQPRENVGVVLVVDQVERVATVRERGVSVL